MILRGRAIAMALASMSAAAERAAADAPIVPPLEIELGRIVAGAPDGTRVGASQLLLGLSWASAYPKPTPVDVTIGIVSTFVRDQDTTFGAYLDVGACGVQGEHWRVWMGGRAELNDHEPRNALGGAARASVEMWTGMAHHANDLFLGSVALSVWAETGLRQQPTGGTSMFVGAGVGLRLPLVWVNF